MSSSEKLKEQRKLDCDRILIAAASFVATVQSPAHVCLLSRGGKHDVTMRPQSRKLKQPDTGAITMQVRPQAHCTCQFDLIRLCPKWAHVDTSEPWTQSGSLGCSCCSPLACSDKYNFLERAFGEQAPTTPVWLVHRVFECVCQIFTLCENCSHVSQKL